MTTVTSAAVTTTTTTVSVTTATIMSVLLWALFDLIGRPEHSLEPCFIHTWLRQHVFVNCFFE